MLGIDIADAIVVRRSVEKGTKIIEEPIKKPNFAGAEFKNYQKQKLEFAGDIGLASSKGTGIVHLSKLKETKVPSTKGRMLSTGRGTGIRIG